MPKAEENIIRAPVITAISAVIDNSSLTGVARKLARANQTCPRTWIPTKVQNLLRRVILNNHMLQGSHGDVTSHRLFCLCNS